MLRKALFLLVTCVLIGLTPFLMGQGCTPPADNGGGPEATGPNNDGGTGGTSDGVSSGTDTGADNGGNTTPPDSGSTDTGGTDSGGSDTLPPANGGQSVPSLTGTWSGQLTMSVRVAVSDTGPADINDPSALVNSSTLPLNITYGADGVPLSLPVSGLQNGVSQASGVCVGQTSTVTINGVTLTVTVREATYGLTQMRVVLETTITGSESQGGTTMTMCGTSTQTIEATMAAGGSSLSWHQLSDATAQITATNGTATAGSWEATRVEMLGNLARQ